MEDQHQYCTSDGAGHENSSWTAIITLASAWRVAKMWTNIDSFWHRLSFAFQIYTTTVTSKRAYSTIIISFLSYNLECEKNSGTFLSFASSILFQCFLSHVSHLFLIMWISKTPVPFDFI